MKLRRVGDHVVGRLHQHQCAGIAREQPERRRRDGGRRIARHRLEQDSLRHDADLAKLLVDEEAMLLVADHQRRRIAHIVECAGRGVLQQRAIGDERQELLGIGCARQRPEPRARSTRQNDRMDLRRTLELELGEVAGDGVHTVEARDRELQRPVIKLCAALAVSRRCVAGRWRSRGRRRCGSRHSHVRPAAQCCDGRSRGRVPNGPQATFPCRPVLAKRSIARRRG